MYQRAVLRLFLLLVLLPCGYGQRRLAEMPSLHSDCSVSVLELLVTESGLVSKGREARRF